MNRGYPSYFLVLLGTWKVLRVAALLIPRRPLLKEWAYAGAFFTCTGRAIASHLATGYHLGEVRALAILTALTVLPWAPKPPHAALGVRRDAGRRGLQRRGRRAHNPGDRALGCGWQRSCRERG